MPAFYELLGAVGAVTDRIGTATVAIGRDRRGTGVVIADGRVLTNAHNLRDRTTQITFADGRTAQAEVLGADPDGDLVVVGVDTSGATPAEWWTEVRHLRSRHRRRPGVPRPPRPEDHRRRRAHGAAGPRILGRAAGRRRRPTSRHQHASSG